MHKFVQTVTTEFLNELIAEIDNDSLRGIVLGGSHARGNPTLYSESANS